jgi:hypothetical protein
VPRKVLIRKWTNEDIAKLTELSRAGATLARAAAALNRHSGLVQRKARELGLSFPGVRAVREGLRKAGAIEPGRPRKLPAKVTQIGDEKDGESEDHIPSAG